MTYCSVHDVVHELHPTLRVNMQRDYGDDFDAVITAHIEKAEAFVNASLARAYNVPLISPSGIVIAAECKIAAYFAGIAYSEKDEILQDKYEIAKEILNNLVLAEKTSLVEEDENASSSGNHGVTYGSDNKVFTDDELAKW